MKIGLFFGSFNPVHTGHMIIAGYMAEFTDLHKVWMVLSPHNPLKSKSGLLPDLHRLRLIREAIGDSRNIRASDIELKLPQPSYTIDTLTYLKEKYPSHTFSLIMGSDTLETLPKWKNHELILRHEIYVYPRPGSDGGEFKSHPHIRFTKAPLIEISASFLREAIKARKDVRYFFPGEVYEYLKEMHFYEK